MRLTPPAEAAVRSGHPWVYATAVREQNREGRSGELAVIYDSHNRFLAIGLFDPASPIRMRVLHTGKPRQLDREWWRQHLRQTLDRRAGLFGEDTTGYRGCNGESDGWPGLVLDRYDTTLVLKLYTAAWLPHLTEILPLLQEELPHERMVLRLSRNIRSHAAAGAPDAENPAALPSAEDGQILSGAPLEGPVIFRENGIRFEAEVLRGQKTGFFLDQRENRSHVETLAHGREVLNAFSFSGGFSLYAARGGARSVTDLDISAHALASARRNLALNRTVPNIRACRYEAVQADVFEWLRDAPARTFDLVILDPPSLARQASQRAEALRAYGRLARSGADRLRPGGILVAASCSAHVPAADFFTTVRQSVARAGRGFRELRTTAHPPDHPAAIPEAHYLKCLFLRLD